MTWHKLKTIINGNNSFLLSSHVNPDGDSICALLAFYWYLKSLGKDAVIYNCDQVPTKFEFLTNTNLIKDKCPKRKFDVLCVLDASNLDRLGWDDCETKANSIINIDHHRDNKFFGDVNIVDYNASATCQLLYSFYSECSVNFPPYISETLYAGILSDTGGFQFTNTNSTVLRICADLSDKGAECSVIYRKLYASHTPDGLFLRAKILSTIAFYDKNRISSIELHTRLLDKAGANYGDIEGISDLTLSVAGVEVGMFIKYDEKSAHFSLRSGGAVDVGKVAQKIPGGGGHVCAAGCTLDLPLKQAKKKMLEMIREELV